MPGLVAGFDAGFAFARIAANGIAAREWGVFAYTITEQEHEDSRSTLSFSRPFRVWGRKITGIPENARKHVKTGYPRSFSGVREIFRDQK